MREVTVEPVGYGSYKLSGSGLMGALLVVPNHVPIPLWVEGVPYEVRGEGREGRFGFIVVEWADWGLRLRLRLDLESSLFWAWNELAVKGLGFGVTQENAVKGPGRVMVIAWDSLGKLKP